jgi:hypothetical protein
MFPLLALTAAILLLIPAASAIGFDPVENAMDLYGANETATRWSWRGLNPNIFPGYCFNSSIRSINSWQEPLYPGEVVLLTAPTNIPGMIYNWVAKILIQEILGYKVRINDNAAIFGSMDEIDWLNSVDSAKYADFMADSGYLWSGAGFNDFLEEIAEGKTAVRNIGTHSVAEYFTWWATTKAVFDFPQYNLQHWTGYTRGVAADGNTALYKVQMPGNPLLQEVTEVFRNDSWNALNYGGQNQLLIDPGDPSSAWACSNATGDSCTDPSFPSMWFPSWCYPSPRAQCALIWHQPSEGVPGILQSQIVALNLSLGIAFVNNIIIHAVHNELYSTHNLLIYSSNFNGLIQGCSSCVPHFHRVMLPSYQDFCTDLAISGHFDHFDSGSSLYYCDSPPSTSYKLISNAVASKAPRIFTVIRELSFSTQDIQQFFSAYNDFAPNSTDYKQIGCDWLPGEVSASRLDRSTCCLHCS